MNRIVRLTRRILFVITIAATSTHAAAQDNNPASLLTNRNSNDKDAAKPRQVALDVLIQAQPSYRIKAQEWGRAFQELGYTPQFRQPKPGEEIRVENVDKDGSESVHIVAGMSVDGTIRIGKRKFTIADAKDLKALLDELAEFGAGGPPEKSPTWGMTAEQLLEVTQLFSDPVKDDILLNSPVITIESIGLPANVRMKFTDAARLRALGRRPESAPNSLNLIGYSKGTAIAMVLAQYGLGFRPQRIAANSYEIEIDNGNEASNFWPVGWKTQETTAVVLPAYLKSIPVDVEDAEVSALMQVVSERLKVPVFRSTFSLASSGKDLDVLTYTRKNDKVSPSRLLTSIGDKLQLGFDIRVDESGKLFLWATTSEESAAFKNRFAHVKQK